MIKPNTHCLLALMASTSILLSVASAILVQPYNYMLDDSALVNQPDGGSLAPYHNDQSEHGGDKDIVGIIGDSLARLRYSRMLQEQQNQDNQQEPQAQHGHFSQEMAELIQNEQQAAKQEGQTEGQSLPAAVANILLNVAQAADQASSESASSSAAAAAAAETPSASSERRRAPPRGSVMELDTSPSQVAVSQPTKADLKTSSGSSSQWFNPKETIPVLKISSMATPSKYKKVYFRSEKKLVDGAFHSVPAAEQNEKKSLIKSFNSGVQRRSSRGTASSAPPSPLQDGVIEFLKKFRDVYIQTRPISTASAGSSLASSVVSAAASSPFAAILSPSGSRPNFASQALSAASSMVNGAAMVAQAAASSSPSSSSSASSTSGSPVGAAVAGAAAGAGSSGPSKSPLSAQTYVSFWSKTFPTWVRKMLKQLRRRSLHNSKRQQQAHQQHHHHSAAAAIGQAAQAAASGAVASVVDSVAASSSSAARSSSSSSSSSSSH